MRCLIIDDEPLAQGELRRLLAMYDEVVSIDCAGDIETSLQLYEANHPDVVFLDIQLRGENGFDFLNLALRPLPEIVFVTAFDQYAIQAFDRNALDYLLKPVHPTRLEDTMARLRKAVSPSRQDSLLVPMNGTVRRIRWTELNAIESEGNYTRLHMADGASAMILRPLKEWMEILPAGFIQVHRSALVRVAAIEAVRPVPDGRREVVLGHQIALPVSRNHWPNLKQQIG